MEIQHRTVGQQSSPLEVFSEAGNAVSAGLAEFPVASSECSVALLTPGWVLSDGWEDEGCPGEPGTGVLGSTLWAHEAGDEDQAGPAVSIVSVSAGSPGEASALLPLTRLPAAAKSKKEEKRIFLLARLRCLRWGCSSITHSGTQHYDMQ